ncbi:FkbM family methyltransferase [Mucisphaera calidilacus]|uniref:Methyltransferase FkbM domain-containing protein n=1 Tax=Mucisphaera calidilacus TaxID=2527982 RepID=A0A518BZT1_9BACT|nr:FkbM family methyltransferase [Mucisphaera calidilacus]QDU72483.1 hypothetical protein Pan265_23490 [Mucisphaera calidilacus]
MLSGWAEAGLRGYARIAWDERGGYRLVRAVSRLRHRDRWQDRFRTPDGLLLDLDLATYPDCCMAFGLYELSTARLIKRLVRTGDVVVDGGANLGYFTLLMASRVGDAGSVHAFEPDPVNRARLVAHLELNGLQDRVVVHPVALSDRSGTATLHRFAETDSAHNHGMSSLFDAEEGATQTYEVQTVRMDEVVKTNVRLVKLDLEGAEPLAVAGMSGQLVGDAPPMVLGEYGFGEASRAGHTPAAWMEGLRSIREDWRFEVVRRGLQAVELRDGSLKGIKRQVNVLARVD